ncbi:hypothetical protein WDU94_000461, partial [Cyamophila willieti]
DLPVFFFSGLISKKECECNDICSCVAVCVCGRVGLGQWFVCLSVCDQDISRTVRARDLKFEMKVTCR